MKHASVTLAGNFSLRVQPHHRARDPDSQCAAPPGQRRLQPHTGLQVRARVCVAAGMTIQAAPQAHGAAPDGRRRQVAWPSSAGEFVGLPGRVAAMLAIDVRPTRGKGWDIDVGQRADHRLWALARLNVGEWEAMLALTELRPVMTPPQMVGAQSARGRIAVLVGRVDGPQDHLQAWQLHDRAGAGQHVRTGSQQENADGYAGAQKARHCQAGRSLCGQEGAASKVC